jgi:hypothetical protein
MKVVQKQPTLPESDYGSVTVGWRPGFQLRTSCERNSGHMGAEGDPALALKRSMDIGMQRNAAGLQPVLRDGAALFK